MEMMPLRVSQEFFMPGILGRRKSRAVAPAPVGPNYLSFIHDSLLVDIFQIFTSLHDLSSIARVCRQFNKLIWSRILSLNLSSFQHGRFDQIPVDDAKLATIVKRCPIIHKLNLSDCREITSTALLIIAQLNNLRSLSIRGCRGVLESALPQLGVMTRLESLDISHNPNLSPLCLGTFIGQLKGLEKLCLAGNEEFDDDSMKFVALIPGLKSLDISECRKITENGILALDTLTSLTRLDISGNNLIKPRPLMKMTSLRTLKVLRMCSVIVSASQSVPAAALLQTLGSLEELSLGFCKIEEKDYEFLLRLSNLRKLSMNNIRHFTASTFQYFVHLTSLSFTRSYLPIGALPYLVDISKLNLDQCTIERQEDGGEVGSPDSDAGIHGSSRSPGTSRSAIYDVRKLKNLKKLSLGINKLTDRELKRVGNVASLESLNLSWTSELTWKGFRKLETLSALRCLNLTNCPNLTDKAVTHLAPYLSNLEELSLSHSVRITNVTIDTIVKYLKHLKFLVLFHLPLITDDGAHRLGGISDLEFLDLSGCHNVSYPCVQYIQQLVPRCHINCIHLFQEKSKTNKGGSCVVS